MNGLPIGRPRFLSVDEALAFQELVLSEHGGASGIRDRGLLESALAQPKAGFGGQFSHAYPFEMAAAYAFHVAKNHPFVDGNKRAALMCCGTFLRMNGWDLVSQGEEAADAVLALVEGKSDKTGFAEWLRAHTQPRPSLELRDFFSALSPQQLAEYLNVFTMPRSIAEADVTGFEALAAMPAMAGLIQTQQHFERNGQDAEARAMAMPIIVLVAIFRIAEDMGYEW